jgi:hypothetical protein
MVTQRAFCAQTASEPAAKYESQARTPTQARRSRPRANSTTMNANMFGEVIGHGSKPSTRAKHTVAASEAITSTQASTGRKRARTTATPVAAAGRTAHPIP